VSLTFPGLPLGSIGPAETAPTVDAGDDQVVVNELEAELDGTVTDAFGPAGGYTTLWTKVSGPGTVTFDDASSIDTDVEFSEYGVYVLRLTATDGVTTTYDDVIIALGEGGGLQRMFVNPAFESVSDPIVRVATRNIPSSQIP
jgi:hypothetical protein